jgi:integrin beta 8
MPFTVCDIKDKCGISNRNDRSYWLRTSANKESDENISGAELEDHISRCVVCEANANVMALHSQTAEYPTCPDEWSAMWIGYSFISITDAGGRGGGQQMESAGSCLGTFRTTPFIQCQGNGNCNTLPTAQSFWLSTVDQDRQFVQPQVETLRIGSESNLRSRSSRCAVCQKSPTTIDGYDQVDETFDDDLNDNDDFNIRTGNINSNRTDYEDDADYDYEVDYITGSL